MKQYPGVYMKQHSLLMKCSTILFKQGNVDMKKVLFHQKQGSILLRLYPVLTKQGTFLLKQGIISKKQDTVPFK